MTPEQFGPYRIVRLLGRGGMGAVYQAVNVETDEPVALKSLVPGLSRETDFRQRFEIEIETLRKLRHPNIVRLLAFGEQEGQLYYAMELVDGRSLEDELHDGRRFDWREVTLIAIQTCHALRHAHDRGIIHRDIKPANLLLTRDNQVKLSDFGIARLFGITQLTAVGSVLGSVEYMAPEQADARPVGPRTDLYSLGGVLFALLAGRAPFKARSIPEMLNLQRSAKPDPVSRYAFGVPDELEHIIGELLEKDPDKRIANAMILGRRLQAMLQDLSISEHPPGADKATTADVDFDPQTSTQDPDRTELHQMPPTRTVPGGSPQPSLSFDANAPRSNLPETRETAAFQAFEPGYDILPKEQPEEEQKQTDRFVVVPEEDLDRHEVDEHHAPLVSPHTWALAGALVIMGLGAWYFLRPPSADRLYAKITAETADNSIESLRAAAGDIDKFLVRFSDDPRADTLRDYAREIELDQMETQFNLRMRGWTRSGNLLPIERAYQEARNYAAIDPDLAVVKLQAVVDLYNHRRDAGGLTGKCLELARRRLDQLKKELKQPTQDYREMLTDRLDVADKVSKTDPQRARHMWQAVIELYSEKPWAVDAVDRARKGLASVPEPSASPQPKDDSKKQAE